MFRGSIVALVTPMHADGEIDDASLQRLVDFHVAQGTSAIVSVGTTGDFRSSPAPAPIRPARRSRSRAAPARPGPMPRCW